MKLAYWINVPNSKNDIIKTLYSISEGFNLFIINEPAYSELEKRVFNVYNYGRFNFYQFNNLDNATKYCVDKAMFRGYRVLTEAEVNLL